MRAWYTQRMATVTLRNAWNTNVEPHPELLCLCQTWTFPFGTGGNKLRSSWLFRLCSRKSNKMQEPGKKFNPQLPSTFR